MLETTNYKLKKIELSDSPPDITVLNQNWDKLDTELKNTLEKAMNKDGGNADTVDGKHAHEFAPGGYGLGGPCRIIKDYDLNDMPANLHQTGFYMGEKLTNTPNDSLNCWWYVIQIYHNLNFIVQIGIGLNSMKYDGKMFIRNKYNNAWGKWYLINDNGNADTVDNVHAHQLLSLTTGGKPYPADSNNFYNLVNQYNSDGDGRFKLKIYKDNEDMSNTYKIKADYADSAASASSASNASKVNGKTYSAPSSTIVIAASDSMAKNKTAADYVCTGLNDQTVIQSAINALPETGGKIQLLEGTFYLRDTINITKENINLSVCGMSSATRINYYITSIPSSNIMFKFKRGRFVFKDFDVSSNSVSDAAGTSIKFFHADKAFTYATDKLEIDNVNYQSSFENIKDIFFCINGGSSMYNLHMKNLRVIMNMSNSWFVARESLSEASSASAYMNMKIYDCVVSSYLAFYKSNFIGNGRIQNNYFNSKTRCDTVIPMKGSFILGNYFLNITFDGMSGPFEPNDIECV